MNKLIRFITLLSLIFVAISTSQIHAQEVFKKILDNGPADSRINIVLLAEGFTLAEQASFDLKAQELLDYMLTVSPISDYTSYFNGYSIFVASNESGSDHPFSSIYKDTYFNSSYDSYGLQRLITMPPNEYDNNYLHGSGKVTDLLIANIPQYDIVCLIVNDPEYGGSGGEYALTSIHPSSPEVIVHELGHSFADLGDEYDTYWASAPASEEPNTTQETVRELIKWNYWILPTTPIPTPEISANSNLIGLFEGAHYNPTGWYRPKLNCKMQILGVDFCEVCSEQMVLSTYGLVSPIDSIIPENINLVIEDDVVLNLQAIALQPDNHSLVYEWTINDSILPNYNLNNLDVSPYNLKTGANSIQVRLYDPSTKVRYDPSYLLTDSFTWDVTFTSCCINIRGNVTNDIEDDIDISDLVMLVDFMFNEGVIPVCLPEANIDGDSQELIDISDLVYLVDYMFNNGVEPPSCP